MQIDNSIHLLAGTRVVGGKLHLGTYYGMLDQLNSLSTKIKVSFILSDLQSWDVDFKSKDEFDNIRNEILYDLSKLLNPKIAIYQESKLNNISNLGLKLATNCTKGMINRISSVKGQRKDNKSPSISSLLYPSMMSANMIAVGANHMFNRPESRFQPIDLINEINKKSFGKSIYKFSTIQKKETFIPAINGEKSMSRSRLENGVIEVVGVDFEYIKGKLYDSLNNNSGDKLYVIKNLWKVVFNGEEFPNNLGIENIINLLSNRIILTLELNNGESDINYKQLYENANNRIKKAMEILI